MLRDPFDDNVVPIIEELRRRLPLGNAVYQGQGEEEEHPGVQHDVESGEENGNTSFKMFLWVFLACFDAL